MPKFKISNRQITLTPTDEREQLTSFIIKLRHTDSLVYRGLLGLMRVLYLRRNPTAPQGKEKLHARIAKRVRPADRRALVAFDAGEFHRALANARAL